MNLGFAYDSELRGGSQISTGGEDFTGCSTVVLTLSNGLESEPSDSKAKNATVKGDYLWQVVGIVIGGIPAVLEVPSMCLFMSFGRKLLQGSISTNLFEPM